ncbi:hypothetical protein L1987_01963 [Smallanthus sonchifolius]|uniref:Uncharacterized protein n=1 Tax=Smallanthus sonchifolius TaxID=185202 RepID=A0ACB9K6P9_9ASTR|nr:hypothetical protein L1987_01963 [Smallanthus sonchifolius]
MYFGTSSTAKSSGSRIAIFSGNSHKEDNSNVCSGHACYAASGSGSGSHHRIPQEILLPHLQLTKSAIAKIAEDHVALFSSCMLAYENLIGGKLTDPETIEEDFNQVDPNDMEDMDIQWNMAMILECQKDKAPASGFTRPIQGNGQGYNNSNNHNQGQGGTSNALVAQQVGLMAEIMEMMETEEREASVANQEEFTTAVALMAIGEASCSSKEFHLDVANKGIEKRNNEINKLQNEILQLKDNIEKLKNSRFVVEHYDKANSTSDEEFFTASDDGSENTCPEGVVYEELLGEQKVKKNIITDSDNCILTEPGIIESNEKLKVMLYGGYKNINQVKKEAFSAHYGLGYQENMLKYYIPKNQSPSGQTTVYQTTSPAHHAESSNARSNEPYRRTYKEKRTYFHCGMSPPVKHSNSPKASVAKPPVKPMVKPKITSEAKPYALKREKLSAKPCASTSGSAPTAYTSSPAAIECKPNVPVKKKKRSGNKKSKSSQSPDPKSYKDSPIFDSHDCELIEGHPKGTISNRCYVDSGCSRHMTGNMALRQDVKPFRGGYVAFAGEKGDDCMPCKKGKQQRKSHKHKFQNSIDTPLELLHMDLFGPISIRSIGGTKDDTADILQYLILSLESLCKLKKGIRHEFSAPYTPQQNGVAERKNRTLIETARTMLSDAKLPVTFWAEAVNTTCHILNRVLVVKRHNKTCYELINNRPPNLDYLVPFGSPFSLLLLYKDQKSKFHAKAVEGIFLGYVTNSPCKRVYNIGTRTVEEWFKVDCSKHRIPPKPTGPAWGFDYGALFKSFNLPDLSVDDATNVYDFFNGGDDSNFSTRAMVPIVTPDSNAASGTPDSDDVEVVHVDGDDAQANPNTRVRNEAPADPINVESSSSRSHDMGELSMNLDTNLQEPDIPETRVLKNHPIDNITGDPHAGVQTHHRTIAENTSLYARILDTGVMETCLHATFVSRLEPKNVNEALTDNC